MENDKGDKAVGKVNIPGYYLQLCKNLVASDEIWFPIVPPEADFEIGGKLKLKIAFNDIEVKDNLKVTGKCGANYFHFFK